jgi:hypothetical protein
MATTSAGLPVRRDAIERLSAETADTDSDVSIHTSFGNAILGSTPSLHGATDC